MSKRRVAVLGSTGSVGTNALRILAEHADRFAVAALAARSSAAELAVQCRQFLPAAACLTASLERPTGLPAGVEFCPGETGVLQALERGAPDVVLNAITGAAGLRASEWALRHGLCLALANKESLVMAGDHLTRLAKRHGGHILPVDSEHCAIHQCLRGEDPASLRRIYLTASGGPFRQRALATMAAITPQEALQHPTWKMGPRITIGSATMMNKAFEVLEAHWLFGLRPDQIEVLIHPQSIVHSMVEFHDGSMLAQLGLPDMRVPILYCLGWPDRLPFDFQPFDARRWQRLEFEPVDPQRFPAVPLAFETLQRGGDSGAVLNAADEVMTQRFLDGAVSFPAITATVGRVVRERPVGAVKDLDDVLAADREGRRLATQLANTPS